MPRKARIDAPGALHHIIVRGIEHRRIFSDDQDRDNFVERLGGIVTETQTCCFAWALIPNHFSYFTANRPNFSCHGYVIRRTRINRLCGIIQSPTPASWTFISLRAGGKIITPVKWNIKSIASKANYLFHRTVLLSLTYI